MNRNIKLIALDLDDTLLGEDLKIPEENLLAVKAACAKGVRIVLASGRTFFSMEKYAKQLGLAGGNGYMICTNGAEVLQTPDWKLVRDRKVSPQAASRVWELASRYGLPMQYYGDDTIYASMDNWFSRKDTMLTGLGFEVHEDFGSMLDRPRSKYLIPGEPEKVRCLYEHLQAELGNELNILISKPFFLEVLNKEGDKGHALACVASRLGLEGPEVMAVGDAMNDLGMIDFAGTGVAVANAVPAVKKAAVYCTRRSHGEAAVAEAIEHFVLCAGTVC